MLSTYAFDGRFHWKHVLCVITEHPRGGDLGRAGGDRPPQKVRCRSHSVLGQTAQFGLYLNF